MSLPRQCCTDVFTCNATFSSKLPLHPAALSTLVIMWTRQIYMHLGHLSGKIVYRIRTDVCDQPTDLSSSYIYCLPEGVISTFAELWSFKTVMKVLFEMSYFDSITMFYSK